MLCVQCQKFSRHAGPRRPVSHSDLPGWHRLQGVLCSGCGELLPPLNGTEQMLRKLSDLARFGLAAGGGPISKCEQ